MGLIIEHGGGSEYEAVTLPRAGLVASRGTAVYLRRSARPSRRAVLHLSGIRGSLGPADLAHWYNERGFHFYVTELAVAPAAAPLPGRGRARSARLDLVALDAARRYLREEGGIDAMILSADGPAARIGAQWCDARRAAHPVDALILSDPDFGRARRARLNVGCPVLVISVAAGHAARDSRPDIRLGQHVTWLNICDQADTDQASTAGGSGGSALWASTAGGSGGSTLWASTAGGSGGSALWASTAGGSGGSTPRASTAPLDTRRRFFDEMGRWLGAYMYGQVRDQLL